METNDQDYRKVLGRRSGVDRRLSRDRRSGKDLRSYNGPERRSLRFRRSNTDRRNKLNYKGAVRLSLFIIIPPCFF
jgi:hypothetical protein